MIKPFANKYGWEEKAEQHSGYRWVTFSKGPDTIVLRLTQFNEKTYGVSRRPYTRTNNSVIDATIYYNDNAVEVICGSGMVQQVRKYLEDTGYATP